MKRIAPILAAGLLAACTATESGPDDTPETPQTFAAPVPVASSQDILGEWDVVSFDGYRPVFRMQGSARAAMANFGPDSVGLRLECNWGGATGRVREGRFVREEADGPGIPQTLMSCGEEANARESRYFDFFRQRPSVERLADDRLRLTVGERELILQRPVTRRLDFLPDASELDGDWRMEGLTLYVDGGYSGGGAGDIPGRIRFAGNRLGYTRCPQYDLTFRYGGDGKLVKTGGADLPATPEGCEELVDEWLPSGRDDFPRRWDIMKMLHSDPYVEKLENGAMLLSTDRIALVITQQPCTVLNQSDDHSTTWEEDCASPE